MYGHLVLAGETPLAASGHVLTQLLEHSIDKSGSGEVADSLSFWARLFCLKSTVEDS